jgi:hypothetical protein
MRISGARQYDGKHLKAMNGIVPTIDEATSAPSFALWRGLTVQTAAGFHKEQ